ncbi:MAG: hypothetical protein J2P45_07570 [Candidatus Dormibacteraeota bacterium]|nr:hypothetical protein [Candidatus Dormibacteraeota bacterium]
MTIQEVPLLADLVMLLAAVALVVLLVAAAVALLRGRRRPAAFTGAGALALLVVYGAVLVGAGLASTPQQLRQGDTLCFDDWCVAFAGARSGPSSGAVQVDLQVENRGRGTAQRSSLARAYLEHPSGQEIGPLDGRALSGTLVRPQEMAPVTLRFRVPAGLRQTRLVVVEGGDGFGPGMFEIGGETSPFHARAGWPLRLAGDANGGAG